MSEDQSHENGSDEEDKIVPEDTSNSNAVETKKERRSKSSSSLSTHSIQKDSDTSADSISNNYSYNKPEESNKMLPKENSTDGSATTVTNNAWNDTNHTTNSMGHPDTTNSTDHPYTTNSTGHPDNNIDRKKSEPKVVNFEEQSERKISIDAPETEIETNPPADVPDDQVEVDEEEKSPVPPTDTEDVPSSKSKKSSFKETKEGNSSSISEKKGTPAPAPAPAPATAIPASTKPTKHKRENVNVTVPPAPLFESGVNTECIQLLRQLWNVHEEAVQFLEHVRSALCHFRQELRSEDNDFELSVKEKKLSLAFSVAKRNSETSAEDHPVITNKWVPLQPFIDGLKCICDNISEIEKQYVALSVFQSQCKLVLYIKIHHAKQQLTHDRLSILHGINQLIQVSLQLLSSSALWTAGAGQEVKTEHLVHSVFQLTEVYNWCLEASWMEPLEAVLAATSSSVCTTPSDIDSAAETGSSTTPSKIRILVQVNAANRNDSPLLRLSLKPLPATRLLQIVGLKRATFVSLNFTVITHKSFFTTNPTSTSTSSTNNSARVLPMEKYEGLLEDEEMKLSPFAKAFSQCPSLLGRAAVKKSESGEQRLTRSARTKMYNYFHEVVWSLVGELTEDLLLWGLHSAVPLALHSLDTFIALRNSLSLGKHIQETKSVSPMLSTFDSIAGALHSFSLLATWDEKMRDGFESASRVKRPEQVSLVEHPEASQWATDIGSKFGEIVATCISLIDGGNNATLISERMRLAGFSEEEPLGDEAQTLFRLEATLVYFKAWIVKRSKVWLNGWAIPQFLACSQREPALLVQLIKSRESILITREILLISENLSIRLSANHRQMCADDLRAALQQLQSMPEELLVSVGPICRTLSLATLQSYMPSSSHWRGVGPGSGLDPDKPSSYVKIFIDRVIEPVMTASVELVPGSVQESMGKQVVHAACDAWLQYILQKRIRFSEWGAVQLLRDFISLRDWIRNETLLEDEARKSILQLEVLKRCEGVAYLLLRSPGDILGVGKPTRRSRRVAPSSDSVENSPSVSENSVAEDDIPPEMYVPNQQMWLELRLRRGVLSPCCS